MIFTPREIAIAVWLGIGLIFVIRVAGKPLLAVLRVVTRRIILRLIGAALAYLGLWIAVLAHFGFWELSNLKTTILWALTTASVRVAKGVNADKEPKFFSKTLRETLSVAFIVEFLVENYNFSVWIELILVPSVWFLAVLLGVAKGDRKLRPANTVLEWMLVLFMLSYVGHAVYEVSQHIREVATVDTVRELFLPVVLSLLFMPFLFALNVYSVYQQIFGALHWGIEDPALRSYAERWALLRFGWKLDYLKRWRRLLMTERPKSREAIDRLFAEIAVVRRHERNPLPVDPKDGWQPQAAIKFLADEGFVNEDYHRTYDQWLSASNAVKLGDKWSMNTIIYYVSGSAFTANELALELSVSDPAGAVADIADKRFGALAAKLLVGALGEEAAREFGATLDSETFERAWREYHIKLTRDDWSNSKGSYGREFVIQTQSGREAAQRKQVMIDPLVAKESGATDGASP
jgi:hypothetical protein